VTADATYTFSLVVNDGIASSPAATVSVTVTNVDRRPRANAGADQTVEGRTAITLSGTGEDEDGDTVSYAWAQEASDAVQVSLTGADSQNASFMAPDVKSAAVLHFNLTATANGESTTDQVMIVVRPDKAPAVNAGIDLLANGRSTVTLMGSATDPENDEIVYLWTQDDADLVRVTLNGADTATASFTSPDVKMETMLTFHLNVTANGLTSTDTVTVMVGADRGPVANAGADRSANARESVTLQGFGSDPENDAVTYAWVQESGPSVTLTGADTATPSFSAPNTKEEAVLVFKLTVTANGLSATDTVSITVKKSNRRPTAKGLAVAETNEGTAVTMDASESTDPDEDALTYTWVQTGGPTVQLTGANTAKPTFTAPSVSADTALAFTLVVSDADGAKSDAVSVSVMVKNVNKAPVAQARKLSGGVSGETISLDASLSKDEDGEQLTYKWEQKGGPGVTLSSDKEPSVTFQAPVTAVNVTLTFKVTVTDTNGATASQEVQVEVTPAKEEGGCSSTGNTSGGAMLLALLAGLFLSRRRLTLRA
jgi:MYXO-CTERM domain-containing protein